VGRPQYSQVDSFRVDNRPTEPTRKALESDLVVSDELPSAKSWMTAHPDTTASGSCLKNCLRGAAPDHGRVFVLERLQSRNS